MGLLIVIPSPSWSITSGRPLPSAATLYPVLRGHIASFLVQFGLRNGQIFYMEIEPKGDFRARIVNASPTWFQKDPTNGLPLPRAATQYTILRGHTSSVLGQLGLKYGQIAYTPCSGSGWSTYPQAGPLRPYYWTTLPRAATQYPILCYIAVRVINISFRRFMYNLKQHHILILFSCLHVKVKYIS